MVSIDATELQTVNAVYTIKFRSNLSLSNEGEGESDSELSFL